jgi:hypothetical protein
VLSGQKVVENNYTKNKNKQQKQNKQTHTHTQIHTHKVHARKKPSCFFGPKTASSLIPKSKLNRS